MAPLSIESRERLCPGLCMNSHTTLLEFERVHTQQDVEQEINISVSEDVKKNWKPLDEGRKALIMDRAEKLANEFKKSKNSLAGIFRSFYSQLDQIEVPPPSENVLSKPKPNAWMQRNQQHVTSECAKLEIKSKRAIPADGDDDEMENWNAIEIVLSDLKRRLRKRLRRIKRLRMKIQAVKKEQDDLFNSGGGNHHLLKPRRMVLHLPAPD